MKKIFLLSVLCPLLLGVSLVSQTPTLTTDGIEVVEELENFDIYVEKLAGVESKVFTNKSLVVGTGELDYSNTYTQYGVNPTSGNDYLRFVTAVKGEISSLNYTLKFDKNVGVDENDSPIYEQQIKTVEIDTIYKGITAEGVTKYYGENGFTEVEAESTYYFACFTLEFKSETELKTIFSAQLNVEKEDGVIVNNLEKLTTLNEVKYNNPDDYNVLILGSDLMGNYNVDTFLPALVQAEDGVNMNYTECLSGSFTFSIMNEPTTKYYSNYRKDLALIQYDAIVLQISRRVTESASDVIDAELAAIKEIYPLLHEETENVYLMAYASEAKPSIFTTSTNSTQYSKTGNKETSWTTKRIGCEWYASLATSWANSINELNEEYKCEDYLYSLVYADANDAGIVNKATVGYLIASSMYMKLFGKTFEDTTILNDVGGVTMTSEDAVKCKEYAAKHCLPQE